jgi:uncharacterized membrane protein
MAVPAAPPLMYVPPPAQTKRRGPLIAGGVIGLIALIVILVIALKPKTPETPIETDQQRQVRLQQEALKAQQQRDEQARKDKELRDQQAKDAEKLEVSRAEADETAFAQMQTQLMQGLNGNYHSVTFHNNCAKADILVASTYMDLQGNWVTHGWWKVTSLGTLDPNLYSKSPVLYFYAHSVNPELVWNTGDSTIDATVAGNRFMHKMASPALGSDKRTVKMFKSVFADQYGRHSQSFTCGS